MKPIRRSVLRFCPSCDSADHVIPVIYGSAAKAADDDTFNHYHYGGVVMQLNAPAWYCTLHGLVEDVEKTLSDAVFIAG